MSEKILPNWVSKKLKDFVNYKKGKKPKGKSEEYSEGYVPYLSTTYLRDGIISSFAKVDESVIPVNDRDILLIWDGSNAGEFLKGKKGILSSTMVKINIKSNIFNKDYLFYQLKKKEIYLRKLTQGTGIPHVDKSVLMNISIPKPPLPEQEKIASILSKVDEQIKETERIIEKTELLKKGLMQKLLTKGIGHTKFKNTELGEIPEEWDIVEFGTFTKQMKDTVLPDKQNKLIYVGLEHIKPKEIFLSDYGTSDSVKSLKFKFKQNDILYGKLRPYLDKAVLATEKGICSTDIIVIQSKSNSTQDFVIYILHSKRFLDYVNGTTAGSNLPRTSWKSIYKYKIPLPPLPEQEKIASILSKVDTQLQDNHNYLN
ncbi:MAG: restriction endonuclease subunit S, partial [Methanosarcinaceae archaeon]|nr:restriction endonuclease subunit S [Methanosarcinaceae archaeon]